MILSYNLEPRKAICYVQEPDPRVQETVFSSNMGIRKQLWQGKVFESFFKYTKLFYNVKQTPNIQGWSLPPWAPASWLLCWLRGQSGPRWACVGMSVGSSRSKSKREAQVLKPELELESADGQSIFTKPPSFRRLCAGSGAIQEKSDSIRQWCWLGLTLAANSQWWEWPLAGGCLVLSQGSIPHSSKVCGHNTEGVQQSQAFSIHYSLLLSENQWGPEERVWS